MSTNWNEKLDTFYKQLCSEIDLKADIIRYGYNCMSGGVLTLSIPNKKVYKIVSFELFKIMRG